MEKALIITGGYINFERICIDPQNFDMIIAADSGYISAEKLNIVPDIIVGDFDSAPKPKLNAQILTMPAEKDDTDTMLACNIAIERGAKNILILGGTGGRADHFLSNVFSLETFCDRNIKAKLTDGENTITVLKDETVVLKNSSGYFSLFSLGECIVTLSGCKYPLNEYILTRANPSFAVSNEVTGEAANVTVQGKAILCESIQ